MRPREMVIPLRGTGPGLQDGIPPPLVALHLVGGFPQTLNNLRKTSCAGGKRCQNPFMEFIWVVPRSEIFPRAGAHGLLSLAGAELEERFLGPAREKGFFVERRYAETRPELKQPIPYVAVTQGDTVLTLTRLNTQGESRLHGKRSVGVGGHINPCDAPETSEEDLFLRACHRELHEELQLPEDVVLPLSPLGLLNDDTTEVGAVHMGLVYRLNADDLTVSIRETSAMEGHFENLASLTQAAHDQSQNFETWSELLLQSEILLTARQTLTL